MRLGSPGRGIAEDRRSRKCKANQRLLDLEDVCCSWTRWISNNIQLFLTVSVTLSSPLPATLTLCNDTIAYFGMITPPFNVESLITAKARNMGWRKAGLEPRAYFFKEQAKHLPIVLLARLPRHVILLAPMASTYFGRPWSKDGRICVLMV
jgi:hypothetical protein